MKSRLILSLISITAAFGFSSCGEVVPPGTATVIRTPGGETKIITKGLARPWGRDISNMVRLAPETIPLDLSVLCGQDAINMKVTLGWTGRFTVNPEDGKAVEKLVEMAKAKDGEEINLRTFWANSLESFAIDTAKNIFAKVEPDDMNQQREQLSKEVAEAITTQFKTLEFPIETMGVTLTNLDFPDEIDERRKRIADARLQDNENAALAEAAIAEAKRQAGVAAEEGKARLVTAQAEAEYFKTLADAMDPQVLELRRLETLERVAADINDSPGSTLVILPFSDGNNSKHDVESTLLWDALKRNAKIANK